MFEKIFSELKNPDCLVIVPTKMLVGFLLKKYNEHKKEKYKSWDSLRVLTLNNFLEEIYQNNQYKNNLPRLLSNVEQNILLLKLLEEDNFFDLFKILSTIESISQNIVLSKNYNIGLKDIDTYAASKEQKDFLNLYIQYKEKCHEQNLCDSGDMIDILLRKKILTQSDLPKKIILLNFLEITPKFKIFLNYISNIGVSVEEYSISEKNESCFKIICDDLISEIKHAADFAKQKSEEGEKVAVVFPNLEQNYKEIYNNFYETFKGENNFLILKSNKLNSYSLISSIEVVFNLLKEQINLTDFIQFLYSPFFGSFESEMDTRIEIAMELLANFENKFSSDYVLEKLKKYENKIPDLLFRINEFFKKSKKIKNLTGTTAKWSKLFDTLLYTLGWPGPRELNIVENQLYEIWFDVLKSYSKLSFITKSHPLTEALSYISYVIAQKKYSPKVNNQNVIISTPDDIIGMNFDYIWFAGMNKNIWPGECFTNPFIPTELQKKHNLPGTVPSKELERARVITEQIKSQAKNSIIFSYSMFFEQSKSFPSALIDNVEYINFNLSVNDVVICDMEEYKDTLVPSVSGEIEAGVRFLELQIQCPFKAFAELRLKIKTLFDKKLGFDFIERGQIAHDILFKFFKKIKNKNDLLKFNEADLQDILLTLTDKSLKLFWQNKEQIIPKYIYELERKRFINLILKWLEIEKKRDDFEVLELETEKHVEMAGVKFKIKIDRIDKTDIGKMVIDYKTGECSVNDWFDDLKSPQLPLYAINSNAQAVSFASLKSKKLGFKGVAERQIDELGVLSNWHEQVKVWEDTIIKIIEEYKSNFVEPRPIEGKKTCSFCSFQSFCKIKV